MAWWKNPLNALLPPTALFDSTRGSLAEKAFADPGADQERERRRLLYEQGGKSAAFADQGESNYNALTGRGTAGLDYLQGQMMGQNSVSAEQLRQGLQQSLAAQSSFAAGASPRNAAMAARTAAIQSARLGAGMSGQAALAGLQERNQAAQLFGQQLGQMRGQDLNAALQARQSANAAYGAYTTPMTPEPSWLEKYGPSIRDGIGAIAASDRRLKTDIRDGEDDVNKAIEGVRAYVFKYKGKKYGKGKQVGVLAQDLERAGLGHAVIDTPEGKMVHGAKLATANTSMIAALGRRLKKIEAQR
jgi:hypothetical protein